MLFRVQMLDAPASDVRIISRGKESSARILFQALRGLGLLTVHPFSLPNDQTFELWLYKEVQKHEH